MTSKIEWTNETWNPVTGCTEVSEGCKNCYARAMHKRLQAMKPPKYQHDWHDVRFHTEELDRPYGLVKPRMMFVNSMSDTFHPNISFEQIDEIFAVMDYNKQHTFQVLTKRPERAAQYFSEGEPGVFPYQNVWIGTSVENQKAADERVPHLLNIPAKVRFLSIEPCLGSISLPFFDRIWPGTPYRCCDGTECSCRGQLLDPPDTDQIHWIIIGCESGPKRRPCKLEWVKSIVNECDEAGVPVFVKQLDIDGRVSKDMSEWPEWARRREFPEVNV